MSVATVAHAEQLARYDRILQQLRKQLRIPGHYQITIRVHCYDESDVYGAVTWQYLPYHQYQIRLLCTLDDHEATWILAHELIELMLVPITDHARGCFTEPEAARHDQIRDEFVEWAVRAIFGSGRPLSLTADRHAQGMAH